MAHTYFCWKRNFPLTSHMRLSVGRSVCHNKERKVSLPMLLNKMPQRPSSLFFNNTSVSYIVQEHCCGLNRELGRHMLSVFPTLYIILYISKRLSIYSFHHLYYIEIDGQIVIQIDRQINRQIDREKEKQKERGEREREREIESAIREKEQRTN